MQKMLHVLIVMMVVAFITGCATIKPEIMKKHLEIEKPKNAVGKTPVIFYFQGSGGWNGKAYDWAQWFKKYGVSAVMIGNAQVRKIRRLNGVDYASDLSVALEVVKDDTSLDLSRYAVMGFSRGGTSAMKSNNFLTEEQPKPDFVFALYPADTRGCPSSYDVKDGTLVHIFYGDLDDWGNYRGIRSSCEATASWNDNVSFHLLKGVEHGYDGDAYDEHKSNGITFISLPNKDAVNETKKVILKAIKEKWGL